MTVVGLSSYGDGSVRLVIRADDGTSRYLDLPPGELATRALARWRAGRSVCSLDGLILIDPPRPVRAINLEPPPARRAESEAQPVPGERPFSWEDE